MMKVTVERLDDINIILAGEVEHSVIEKNVKKLEEEAKKAKEETKKELKHQMKDDVPVDDSIVENVLDSMNQDNFQRDAEGQILQEFIETGLKEAKIPIENILGQPGFKKYEKRDNSIYLEVQISTSPKIDTEVDYKDIIPTFTQPLPPKEDVDTKLKEMVIQQAVFTSIKTPRAVAHNDMTVIDFDGFIDGAAFDGGKAEKFNLKVGSKSFIPGFEEQVLGMNYAEEKSIKVTFPENYSSKDLAGKEAEFKVKLHEIQEQQYTEPDDAFAQRILNDKEATLDTLRSKLADQLTSQALSSFYQEKLKPILIKGLLSKFDFTLPINVVEQEIDAKVNEKAQAMSQEDQALYRESKEKFHELRNTVREEARNAIKIALIVDALAKKEGIEVDEQEIQAALYYQAMMTGQDADDLLKYYKENNLMTSAKMGLTEDKLFGRMLGFDK